MSQGVGTGLGPLKGFAGRKSWIAKGALGKEEFIQWERKEQGGGDGETKGETPFWVKRKNQKSRRKRGTGRQGGQSSPVASFQLGTQGATVDRPSEVPVPGPR